MNWARERDLLISQTMAFVQSIAPAKPETDVRPQSRTESTSATKAEEAKKPEEVERPAGIVPMTRLSLVPPGALREEVKSRVAAFRAHQQLLNRERDAYFMRCWIKPVLRQPGQIARQLTGAGRLRARPLYK